MKKKRNRRSKRRSGVRQQQGLQLKYTSESRALKFLKKRWFEIALGLVLLFVGFYADDLKAKKETNAGSLDNISYSQKIYIAVGATVFQSQSEEFFNYISGQDTLFSVARVDGVLKFSAKLYDPEGQLIAEICKNEWQINNKLCFDRNFNDSVLEVRRNTGEVVLQVALFDSIIAVAGIFRQSNGNLFAIIPVGDSGAVISRPSKNEEDQYTDLLNSLEPICIYPSSMHFEECPGILRLKSLVRKAALTMLFTA